MRELLLGIAVALAVALPGCMEGFNFGSSVEPSTWAFDMTGLSALQAQGYTGRDIRVAIVDTGIDLSHPDLQGVTVEHWHDYVNGRSDRYDDDGHGTMVAGIIVAQGIVKGGAPGVRLAVYKAISAGDGTNAATGRDADVAAAIRRAVDNGAHIICLSLGSGRGLLLGPDTAQAASDAAARGVYVVAAAGNEGENPNTRDVTAPADVQGVIAVGSLDAAKKMAASSNPGATSGPLGPTSLGVVPRQDPDKKPEVSAPGVRILSTYPGGNYAYADGTSMATPFVAAGIALLLEAKPTWKPGGTKDVEDMKLAIMKAAEKIPGQRTPHDPKAGYGLFRADLTLGQMR